MPGDTPGTGVGQHRHSRRAAGGRGAAVAQQVLPSRELHGVTVHDVHALDPVIKRHRVRRLRGHLIGRQFQDGRIGGDVDFERVQLAGKGHVIFLDWIAFHLFITFCSLLWLRTGKGAVFGIFGHFLRKNGVSRPFREFPE
jgi:hypothetical protein